MTPQELRNSIINLAIQGKLVEQRAVEKSVICDSTYVGDISDLYEIPEKWKWVSLKDVVSVTTGLSFKKQDQRDLNKGTLRVLRGGNIGDDYKYHLYDDDVYVDLQKFKTKYTPLIEGDVITPSVTSIEKICKTGFIDESFNNITAGGFVYIIRSLDKEILHPKYLLFFISSAFNKEQCKPNIHKSGQAFYNLKKTGFIEQPISVPPLTEQKRIVERIEELLPLVDQYEQAWTKLEAFNARFPMDMQKSILQMAIQGKLVPQDASEGTGEELYKQIQTEKQALIKTGKIKKEKSLPDITEEEIPFDIPESWKWVRWGNLSESIQYGYNAPAQEDGRIKMVRISDIQNRRVIWETVPYCEIAEQEIHTYLLAANDILFARTGGTVGKSYLVKEVPEEAIYAGYLIRTRYSALLCPEYMKYFMDSQLYWNQLRSGTIATAQPNCNGKTLAKMILPLPPLAEQKRIVAKLEELLPLCERLK